MALTFWQPPQGLTAAHAQIADLTLARDLRFETSQRLIDLVTKHQSSGKTMTPFGPSGISNLSVVPFDVLHALGIASTPAIPSAAHLSQWWAILRYLWAFRPYSLGQTLALDSATSAIRHHQRTLLSEQLAIGLSGWFIENIIGLPSTHSVDADLAIYDPAWQTLLTWAGDMLPDYIYFSSAAPTAVPTNLHLVECKGTREKLPHHAVATTHNTRYRTLAQFSRAAQQLDAITFAGMKVVRVAFAATLNEDEVCLYALDPPDGEDSIRAPRERPRKTIEVEHGARVINRRRLSSDIRALRDTKLLAFAGAYKDALEALPAAYRRLVGFREQPAAVRDLQQPNKDGVGYRGSRLRIELYDGFGIEIELGLQEDVFEACRTHDGKRLESALAALRRLLGDTTRSVASNDQRSAISQSPAGTMVQVRVTGADAR
jgi:hypothetical protein